MKWMLRYNEFVKRCSSHALGDAVEVATFYDDLIATGRGLGVATPVMESYAGAIRRFAAAGGAGARTAGLSRVTP
jgi:hypothetical protein